MGLHPANTLPVDVGTPPYKCSVIKECCDDQYAVCYSGASNQIVTITRTDTLDGWGQYLQLLCSAASLAPFKEEAGGRAAMRDVSVMPLPVCSWMETRLWRKCLVDGCSNHIG